MDDRYIARPPKRYAHADIQPWLRETVYDGQSLGQFAWWPVVLAAGVAIIGLCAAIPLDVRRLRILRDGKILRGGPRPRTVAEFNRQHRAERRHSDPGEAVRLSGSIRLSRADEASHFAITGVPGSGKSMLIRQLLCQVKARGHVAIVYDPHREFLPEFYDPETDFVLNPLDARCPYWTPGDEIADGERGKYETLTLAESLFPERRNDQPFFASSHAHPDGPAARVQADSPPARRLDA